MTDAPLRTVPRTQLSPLVFWVAILALLWLGAMVLSSPSRAGPVDFFSIALAMLCFLGAAALAWQRWAARAGAQWFLRVAALVGVAMLVPGMLGWLDRSDVFVRYCCRDGSMRPATFWPLFFMWGGGLVLAGFALWGTQLRPRVMRSATARALVWWAFALPWSWAAVQVFAGNISSAVMGKSLWPLAKIGGLALLVIAGFGLALAAMSRKHRRRRAEIERDFVTMPREARAQALALIARAAAGSERQVMYRSLPGRAEPESRIRLSGDPIARPGETWPQQDDGTPAWFLVQLPLDAPRLGPVWQSRVAVVFMADWELLVRSYEPDAEPGLVTLANPRRSTAESTLVPHRVELPYLPRREGDTEDDEDDEVAEGENGFTEEHLFARVPGLKALLSRHSEHVEGLLACVLADRAAADWDTVASEPMVGGDPELIQNEHDATCPVCQARMRFLFQFGEPNERQMLLGDAGIAYIYGCDAHPRECLGFVDSF